MRRIRLGCRDRLPPGDDQPQRVGDELHADRPPRPRHRPAARLLALVARRSTGCRAGRSTPGFARFRQSRRSGSPGINRAEPRPAGGHREAPASSSRCPGWRDASPSRQMQQRREQHRRERMAPEDDQRVMRRATVKSADMRRGVAKFYKEVVNACAFRLTRSSATRQETEMVEKRRIGDSDDRGRAAGARRERVRLDRRREGELRRARRLRRCRRHA